jgi:hypothetical protein
MSRRTVSLGGPIKLTTYEAHGQTVQIYVREDGDFTATVQEKFLFATTLDALKTKIRQAGKAAKVVVAIPACKVETNFGKMAIVEVTITGKNAKTGAILYRDEKHGHALQEASRYADTKFLKRIPKASQDELVALYEKHRQAMSAYETKSRGYYLDANKAVEEAINEALNREPDVEEEDADPRTAPAKRKRA